MPCVVFDPSKQTERENFDPSDPNRSRPGIAPTVHPRMRAVGARAFSVKTGENVDGTGIYNPIIIRPIPFINMVNDEDYKKIKEHSTFQLCEQEGSFRIIKEVKVGNPKKIDLTDFYQEADPAKPNVKPDIRPLKEVVDACSDLNQLNLWASMAQPNAGPLWSILSERIRKLTEQRRIA